MSEFPPCPECASEYSYSDGVLMNCPTCGHAWSLDAPEPTEDSAPAEEEGLVVRDSVGNVLQDGDDVVITQTLRVKGAQNALKPGTKVTGIRLIEGHDDHHIDCRIPGFGPMKLKGSVVRKA